MKIQKLLERLRTSIDVHIGDYLTHGTKPSYEAQKRIKMLRTFLTSAKFIKKYNATPIGTVVNNFTSEYRLGFDFETEQDRIEAVKYLRRLKDPYIRNVRTM